MSEQGLFERIRDGMKACLNPLHGTEGCLLFMIEENVKPRDTGTLIIACSGKVVCEVNNLELYSTDPEPVLRRLQAHAEELKDCSFQRVEFKNVSPWLQGEIQRVLDSQGGRSSAK